MISSLLSISPTLAFYAVLSGFSPENSLRAANRINRRGHDAISLLRGDVLIYRALEVSFVAMLGR